jgi:TM2 domain-containing membrane protein YozV
VNPARERAALLRGEGKGGQSAAPATKDPSRVAPAEPQGISAITRISSVNDELEQTVILADVSAQAVALLRETPPPLTARAGDEPSVGAWGAVLGKDVEAQLVVVASPSLPEPTAGQITPRLTDDPRFFAESDDQPDLSAAPSQASPKAFVRLHSPDEARSVLPVAGTSTASSKANTSLRAALFSLLAPGAGQAYNNQQGRALTFALAGVLVVPWLLSIREAWVDAARGMKSPAAAAPNVKAAATVAFTFWLLVGLFGTFIWSIDRATTDSTSAVVSASPPAPAFAPAQSPLAVPRAEEPPMARELAREASGEPSTDRAELRERIAGLVARAQLACNSGEYVDCRQLAEQALALDETDPGAHRVHVVAIEGISAFQERSDAAGFNGPVIGSTPTPRPAVHPRDTVPQPPNPTSPSPVTPALPVAP